MRDLLRTDPSGIPKKRGVVKDEFGRIVSFEWIRSKRRSAKYVYRALEGLSLQTHAEERYYLDLETPGEDDDWSSSEASD